ncbi:MAG TPA: DUF3604 domain-containing protein [Gemmatimonadota bacterium]|nr:DUF3604 domain-containing protein [Gemmatimonadota bacterium]
MTEHECGLLGRLVREPLVHFLVLGAGVFVLQALVNPGAVTRRTTQIDVGPDELAWITTTWLQQYRRPPSESELRGLVDDYVRDEVLYREALAMGLDRDDIIIKRRMVQKMGFLTEDAATERPATRAELERFFTANPERFGGWSYSAADAAATDMVQRGYAGGVAMGSDLPARAGSGAPTFMLWAARDPNSAPLQRMQIVKGWLDASGQTHEQVFDVDCADGGQPAAGTNRCPDNGATVDTTTCVFTEDKGDAELAAFWTDPAFDATQSAFYYVRVLENPTCRWSTWESIRTGLAAPADLAPTLQERAYTSPIWYTPAN